MIDFAIAMVVLIAIVLILQVVPLPEPFKRILMIVLGAVVVIYLLMWLAGGVPAFPRR